MVMHWVLDMMSHLLADMIIEWVVVHTVASVFAGAPVADSIQVPVMIFLYNVNFVHLQTRLSS